LKSHRIVRGPGCKSRNMLTSMAILLKEASLEHLVGTQFEKTVTLSRLAERLATESRVDLLAYLKESGVSNVADRQKIVNTLAKAKREGRLLPNDSDEMPTSIAHRIPGRLPPSDDDEDEVWGYQISDPNRLGARVSVPFLDASAFVPPSSSMGRGEAASHDNTAHTSDATDDEEARAPHLPTPASPPLAHRPSSDDSMVDEEERHLEGTQEMTPAKRLAAFLHKIGLPHTAEAMADLSLDDLIDLLDQGRPVFLQTLKDRGVHKLPERQRIANELSKVRLCPSLGSDAPFPSFQLHLLSTLRRSKMEASLACRRCPSSATNAMVPTARTPAHISRAPATIIRMRAWRTKSS